MFSDVRIRMRAFIFIFNVLFFVCVQKFFCAEVISVKHKGFYDHSVKRGQSLSLISKIYFGDFSRVEKLKRMNQLSDNIIYPGQILKIPSFEIELLIESGDSLTKLSEKYFCGVSSYKTLANLNDVAYPYQLMIGQSLKVPLCKSYFSEQRRVSKAKPLKKEKRPQKSKDHLANRESKAFSLKKRLEKDSTKKIASIKNTDLFSSKKYSKRYDESRTYDLKGVKTSFESRLESSRLIRKPFVYEFDALSYRSKPKLNASQLFSGSPLDFLKEKTFESAHLDEITKPIEKVRDLPVRETGFVPQNERNIDEWRPIIKKRRVRRRRRFKKSVGKGKELDSKIVEKSIKIIQSSSISKSSEKPLFKAKNTARTNKKHSFKRQRNTHSLFVKSPLKTEKSRAIYEDRMSLLGLSNAENQGVELFKSIKDSYETMTAVTAPVKIKTSRRHGIRGLFMGLGKLQGSSGNWDRREQYTSSLRRSVSIGMESYSISPKQSDLGIGKIKSASMPVFKVSKPLGKGGEVSFLTGTWSSKSTDNLIKTTLENKYTFQGFSLSTTELLGRNLGVRLELGMIQASSDLLYADSFGFSFSS
ncbi:LysM peptidoglycan-binding domain-containing protein [bacterium]|nr:LysM peptidoglycan-binding domain-containing protein [bacterium]